MRNLYLYITALTALLFLPTLSFGQYIVDFKKDGDRSYDNENYYAAAVYYQKALHILPDSIHYLPYNVYTKDEKLEKQNAEKQEYLFYRLAESFRHYNDYKNAEKWYKKVLSIKNNRFPLTRLWYGVTLRADGKYQKALEELTAFDSSYSKTDKYSKRAALEIASCQFALKHAEYPLLASIKELPAPVNVKKHGSDYAPMLKDSTLFFTSSRRLKDIDIKKHTPYINKIYKIAIDAKGDYGQPELVKLTTHKFVANAASSFTKNKKQFYFTKWQVAKKGKVHYVIMKMSMNKKGTIGKPVPLSAPVNVSGADTKEAFVTDDGKYLIFSSNRKGGVGGYDLWYCRLNTAGSPIGEAVNMGKTINTIDDEESPYYNSEKQELIFSSNGRVGFGGFDLYKSKGNFEKESWSVPKNMGDPVNSYKDDIFYYTNAPKEGFYLSSDRNSVCCLNIYHIKLRELTLDGHVYNKETGRLISQVKGVVIDSLTGDTLSTFTTGADGAYQYTTATYRPINIHFSHELFGTKDLDIPEKELRKIDADSGYVFNGNIYFSLDRLRSEIVINDIYYDFDKANIRKKSDASLDKLYRVLKSHPKWIVEIGAHTDSIGSDKYNQWLSQQRAQSVVDYLVKRGIPKKRLMAKGYGEKDPIAPNSKPDGSDNPKGRQLNRHTGFKLLGLLQEGDTMRKVSIVKSKMGNLNEIHVDSSRAYGLSKEHYRIVHTKHKKKAEEKREQKAEKEKIENHPEKETKSETKAAPQYEGPAIQMKTIYYHLNDTKLAYFARKTLDSAVQLLKKYPNLMIHITSYADVGKGGAETYTVGLVQKREAACVAYLSNRGIATSRMILGKPKSTAENKKNKATEKETPGRLNRRTVLVLKKKE